MDNLPSPPEVTLPKRGLLGSSTFLLFFFLLTPIVLAISTFALVTVSETKADENRQIAQVPRYTNLFAASEEIIPQVSATTEIGDARTEIVRQYLEKYESPMIDHAEFIVQTADKYGIDFRLITAIAQQESNVCKRIPPDTYNCWGWGIHSEGTLGFRSFSEGIETVSKGLKENYIDKGYTTPDIIMTKYTPSSNGSWAAGVNQFISEMQ